MSRTLGASFIAQKNLPYARPLLSAVFHFGGAIGDVYVSDREITIGGNAHKGTFAEFGEYKSTQVFRDGTFQVREVPLAMINFPIFGSPAIRFTDLWSEGGIEGVEVDVYMNMREFGTATIFQELLFKAVCRPGIYTPTRCQLKLKSVSEKYLDLKEVSRVIEHTTFPLADLDDVGQRMNLPYGALKNIKCHAIVAGLQFALQEAMSAVSGYIAIGQDAYDALPSTGIVQIGDEQIAYTSKTTSPNFRLTGLTRSTNATPLQSHSKDDTVVQVLTEYVYLAADVPLSTTPVKSVANVKIWRNGLSYPLTGFTAELANTTLEAGKTLAVIKVPTPPVIKELPVVDIDSSLAVQDGIAVSDAIGVGDTIAVVDNIGVVDQIGVSDGSGVSDTIGISQANNESQWSDQASDVNVTLVGGTSGVNAVTVGFGPSRGISSGSYAFQFTFQVIATGSTIPNGDNTKVAQSGFQILSGFSAVAQNPITVISGDPFITLQRTWSTVGLPNAGFITLAITGRRLTYAISSLVSKTGAASKTGSTTKSGSAFKSGAASKSGTAFKTGAATKLGTVTLAGEVTLSSTSTAEIVLGEYLTCDIEGYKDDGVGTWTGTANALIEKPADAMHHLARVPGAIPSTLVDSAAFVTARTDAPTSHKLALNISERTNLKELLIAVGMQSRLRPDWPIDKLTVQFLKSSYPAASKIITQEEIAASGNRETTLQMHREDASQLLNVVTIFYGRDWTMSRGIAAFAKLYRTKDAASIAQFKERENPDRFLFDFIASSNDAMAQDIGDWNLARHKTPPRILEAETFLDQFELLPGDVIGVNFHTSLFPASATFAPSGFSIKFDTPGRGIAAARGPQIFDNLNGSQKFLVEEFGVKPGNARDKRGAGTTLVAREVP